MQTIAEVLERLDQIVKAESERESPMGYFPALYHRMSEGVRHGIKTSHFENGARMERLVVLFARRYVEAYEAWYAEIACSRSWKIAFDATADDSISTLQHLMLGINAHINLDLSISAAETRPGEAVFGLRPDFERLNDIIAAHFGQARKGLTDTWLSYPWLENMVGTDDDGLVHFSIKKARGASWKAYTALALTTDKASENAMIDKLDQYVADLAQRIVHPGWALQMGVNLITNSEKGENSEKIALLRSL